MRRFALVPIVAVLVLAACGTGELPQLPLNAAGNGEKAGTADALYPYRQVTYKLGDGVKADRDHADAHQFPAATADDAKRLATAFGIAGDVKANESGWSVGAQSDGGNVSGGSSGPATKPNATSQDSTPPDAVPPDVVPAKPSLTVSRNGSFSVNGSYAVSSGVACASPAGGEPCPSTTTTTVPGLPDESQARAHAERVFKQAGIDVAGMKSSVESNGSAITVMYQPTFDGHTVDGYALYVAFGANDTIAYASGIVGDPKSVGSYELATLSRAVERLNAQRAYPARGGPEPAIAVDEPTNQQPLVVTLTAVRVGLMLSSDADGNRLWLTPAYVFTTDQNNATVTTAAAADKYFPTTTTTAPSTGETKPPASDVPPVSGGSSGSGGGSVGGAGTVEPAPPTPTSPPN